MTLKNMTAGDAKIWAEGVKDAMEEIAESGLWLCTQCDKLMPTPPRDYNICPHCGVEFGINDIPESEGEPLWHWPEKD